MMAILGFTKRPKCTDVPATSLDLALEAATKRLERVQSNAEKVMAEFLDDYRKRKGDNDA